MANTTSGSITSRKDFKKDPSDQYQYWDIELRASEKRLKEWRKEAEKIQRRYIDNRKGMSDPQTSGERAGFRLNLFNANTKTIYNMLYGKLPRIDVSRTDLDPADDVARVGAEILERCLRQDLSQHGEENDQIFRSALLDRLLGGLGCARVRYDAVLVPNEAETAVEGEEPATERLESESAPIDYYYWADVAWGWSRSFADLPWLGFRSYLTQDQIEKRFGKEAADGVELKQRTVSAEKSGVEDPDMNSAWQKAEVWEIWDKSRKKVVWMSPGYPKILDTKKDPLRLQGFYPAPPFFLANPTNALYIPTPDFHLAQDLYNEIDVLQTRIAILTEAVKVVGVYDSGADGIKRMLSEGVENDLIPVDNWAMFAEKGGIQGQVDWLPIQEIVAALTQLITVRDQTISLLQQQTGMADVMRGELQNQYEGVGQTKEKTKFASVRVQALSEEFATFTTNLQQIKAEVICKHFSPETIAQMSNMQFSADRELVPQAIQLLKDPATARYRIAIKSETMAQEDYASLQTERTNYLNGLSTFLQSATPLMEKDRRSTPFLMEMLKWAMAGFKGASEIEGILDKAIEVMSQPEQQKEPPPSEAQQQAQAQLQLEEMRQKGKLASDQAKAQQDMQIREQDMQMDIQTRQAEHQMEMQKQYNEAQNQMSVIAAKMEADVQTELMTSQINADQADRAVQGEIEKTLAAAKINVMAQREMKAMDTEGKIMIKAMDSADKDKDRYAAQTDSDGDDD